MQRNEIDIHHIGHQCKRFHFVHVTKINDILSKHRSLSTNAKKVSGSEKVMLESFSITFSAYLRIDFNANGKVDVDSHTTSFSVGIFIKSLS